ncbi:MAG: symmetrical bis(5'-nucleosyl)-tetraphosphatase [Gammaproteobacteria bacterium]|nr:symmetrical bis(5'-nucleosyl)-tetraphosphatase [Gammaproteobacteria bacterium]
MSLYAIGDVQGCYGDLRRLLDEIRFDPASDQLWFAGDLVNRGPQSLETLRFVKGLGDAARCVLGNHEFHLLRLAAGIGGGANDGLQAVLDAPDAGELTDWLARQPLLRADRRRELILVHAGLLPQWDIETAVALAAEVGAALRADRRGFLASLFGDAPDRWDEGLRGADRLRVIVNAMTRMRFCDADGRMDMQCTGPPGAQPHGLRPWFEFPHRRDPACTVLFGHWAALGFARLPGCVALDSGCVWDGRLTAFRLEPGEWRAFSVECVKRGSPY